MKENQSQVCTKVDLESHLVHNNVSKSFYYFKIIKFSVSKSCYYFKIIKFINILSDPVLRHGLEGVEQGFVLFWATDE